MVYGRWETRLSHVWVALSYRPLDTSLAVWRAGARLAEAFGRERMFFDGFAMQDGPDGGETGVLFAGAAPCVVLFIGTAWNSLALLDPADAHRREVEAALINPRTTLLPVLVDGAQMPRADLLPRSIRGVTERTTLRLDSSHAHDAQMERLVRSIAQALRRATANPYFAGEMRQSSPLSSSVMT